MALGDVQTAMARLFTDEEARAAFARDPVVAVRELGLEAADAASLAALAPRAVNRFAGALQSKRVLDARKLLPLTARVLGDAFARRLREEVRGPPRGAVADALDLATLLSREETTSPAWIGDLARYEAAFVVAGRRPFTVQFHIFRYPVSTIAADLRRAGSAGDVAPCASLAFWARAPGGALMHRCWRVGWRGAVREIARLVPKV